MIRASFPDVVPHFNSRRWTPVPRVGEAGAREIIRRKDETAANLAPNTGHRGTIRGRQTSLLHAQAHSKVGGQYNSFFQRPSRSHRAISPMMLSRQSASTFRCHRPMRRPNALEADPLPKRPSLGILHPRDGMGGTTPDAKHADANVRGNINTSAFSYSRPEVLCSGHNTFSLGQRSISSHPPRSEAIRMTSGRLPRISLLCRPRCVLASGSIYSVRAVDFG